LAQWRDQIRQGTLRSADDPAGWPTSVQWAAADGTALAVVMEATGGVEQFAFLALWRRGMPCALTNPQRVRKFAEALGKLEKTDRIDAEVIARHADALRVNPTRPKSDKQQHLDALSTRLQQVTSDLTVRNAAPFDGDPVALEESLCEVIALLKKQTKDLAHRIAELVNDDPLWSALDQTFRQIKGVADRTVAVLLAQLPEIGVPSNKAVTKLTGLAPNRQRQRKKARPPTHQSGRTTVRNILFLVADIAREYDKSLTEFRQRLLDAGKPKMVVRIALARKLLVRLNATARGNTPISGSQRFAHQIVASFRFPAGLAAPNAQCQCARHGTSSSYHRRRHGRERGGVATGAAWHSSAAFGNARGRR